MALQSFCVYCSVIMLSALFSSWSFFLFSVVCELEGIGLVSRAQFALPCLGKLKWMLGELRGGHLP